jgi:uncharacterized protein DUF1524
MRIRILPLLALAAAVATAVIAVRGGALGEQQPPPRTSAGTLSARSAVTELAAVRVAPAGTMSGYDREQIFPGWADLDGDGCDTREEVLMRDATEYTRFGHGGRCVGAIRLQDPYGHGRLGALGAIQIDHVVPLGVAWRSGGRDWTVTQWQTYANDQANLLAVDGGENMSKGDQTPDEWLPPAGFQCGYAKIYTGTLFHYHLTTTRSTKDTLERILSGRCGR